jgi:hypothetical protein
MRAAEKVSVSLSSEDLAWARARAKEQAKSLSGVLSDALRRQRQAEARLALLQELGTGDITAADLGALRSELDQPKPSKRSRKKAG